MSQEKIDELRAKDPTLTLVRIGGTPLLLRRPTRPEWEEFLTDVASEPTKRLDAIKRTVRECVVYPDYTALDVFLDQRPARLTNIMGVIKTLAGEDEKVEVEKA